MRILITGSLGLVGSEASRFYLERGHRVIGIDNNMRKQFFGEEGCGLKNMIKHENYTHIRADITRPKISTYIYQYKPDVLIHAAGQPSHDWSAKNPMLDFDVNACGTLLLLESLRINCPDSVFVFLSTNKVYGDRPNNLPFIETDTRYELDPTIMDADSIAENFPIDNSTHSPFGASKLAADIMVQEYGRYFGMKTGVFRCGCITGSQHAGVELHGFLSYMAKCKKENRRYTVYGYKGKQVRDIIYSGDLVTAIDSFISNPRVAEVYNMGGGKHSNISILEALKVFGITDWDYVDEPRKGDHQWYISDVTKFKTHYPEWEYQYNMEKIIEELTKT